RLLLRHDNADRRLTPIGHRIGCVSSQSWERLQKKERGVAELFACLRSQRHQQETLERWLRRTDTDWQYLSELHPSLREWETRPDVVEQVVLECKYAGYIGRQSEQVERFAKLEGRRIPENFDYSAIPQLRAEAKQKLTRIRPASIGQASRVSGITPADL